MVISKSPKGSGCGTPSKWPNFITYNWGWSYPLTSPGMILQVAQKRFYSKPHIWCVNVPRHPASAKVWMDPPKHTHQTPHSPQVRYLPQCLGYVITRGVVGTTRFFFGRNKKNHQNQQVALLQRFGGVTKGWWPVLFWTSVFSGRTVVFCGSDWRWSLGL